MHAPFWLAGLLACSLSLVACQPATDDAGETPPAGETTIDKARDAKETIEEDAPPNSESPESEEAEE